MTTPFALAHRVPRTPTAMREWTAAGVRRVEADVQLARLGRDQQVVVSHYLPFLRVRGWVQHDGGRFRWRAGPPFDPTLADVLDLLPPDVAVLLDPKETDPARRADLVDALAVQLAERDRFTVSTADEGDLARYRDAGFPTWRTVKDAAGLRGVLAAGALPDGGVSIRHSLLDRDTIARLHGVVPLVVAWTVNDPSRAAALLAAGVDGITTDRPAVAALVTPARP